MNCSDYLDFFEFILYSLRRSATTSSHWYVIGVVIDHFSLCFRTKSPFRLVWFRHWTVYYLKTTSPQIWTECRRMNSYPSTLNSHSRFSPFVTGFRWSIPLVGNWTPSSFWKLARIRNTVAGKGKTWEYKVERLFFRNGLSAGLRPLCQTTA